MKKNEPNLQTMNPFTHLLIYSFTHLIYAISKYYFLQLFTTFLRRFMRRWDFSTKKVQLFTTFRPKKMRNEPNLKNTKINITAVLTKDYMKNDAFSPRKNEPNSNPIYADSNPICEKNTKIHALSKYNFLQLFTTALLLCP